MKKHNIFENIPIAIVAIILSAATSFAVVQTKVAILEKATDKNGQTMEELKEFKTEQKVKMEAIKESQDKTEKKMDAILEELRKINR